MTINTIMPRQRRAGQLVNTLTAAVYNTKSYRMTISTGTALLMELKHLTPVKFVTTQTSDRLQNKKMFIAVAPSVDIYTCQCRKAKNKNRTEQNNNMHLSLNCRPVTQTLLEMAGAKKMAKFHVATKPVTIDGLQYYEIITEKPIKAQ